MQVADAEGALKAAMVRVTELEGYPAAAPELTEAAPQVSRTLRAEFALVLQQAPDFATVSLIDDAYKFQYNAHQPLLPTCSNCLLLE